jgi:CheY-like chemotaxis protein
MRKEPARILLAEDDPADVELALSVMQSAGSAQCVEVVNDGESALDYLHRRRKWRGRGASQPALVLLDLKMPGIGGIEVLRTIKSSPEFLETPKLERQDVRQNALAHNRDVWDRTALENHPTVKRYLRRNTVDKGLFEKEGKNFTGDFQVGERQGYSYTLKKPDGSLLSNAYMPYELRKVPEG